jgi:predicted DNA-binding transcriptional regulator YafY
MADLLGPIRARLEASLGKRGVRTRLLCKRIRILNIGAREADPGVFRVLMRGVIRRRRVEIRHQGLGDAQPAVRVISPQKLVRYRDNWYVDAFCHLRNDLRTFAINRIDGVRLVQGRFRGVREPQQEAYYGRAYGIFTGPAPHTAEIEFRGTAAREVSREGWHPKQRAEWTHEGCYRLRIPYGQDRELIMDILRWGEEAEVIGPPRLRARVKEALRGALIRYGK